LGLPYTLEQIKKNFLQKLTLEKQMQTSDRLPSLIDIESNLKAMQKKGYARSLEIKNLKAMSKAFLFLEEQGIYTVGALDNKLREVKDEFEATRKEIKKLEDKVSKLSEITKHIRAVEEITSNSETYKANLPQSEQIILRSSIKALKEEGIELHSINIPVIEKELQALKVKKDQLYLQFRRTKIIWRQIQTAKKTINRLVKPINDFFID